MGSKQASLTIPPEWSSNTSEVIVDESPNCLQWWDSLNDSTLNWLIETAYDQNIDVHLAAKNVRVRNCASIEDFTQTWITVSAEVAKTYVELRGSQVRLELLKKNIDSQEGIARLIEGLTTTGFVGLTDQRQAEEQLLLLSSEKPLLELSIDKSIYHLSTLLGYAPGDLYCMLSDPGTLPMLPAEIPIGLPCELLDRRPDIRKASYDRFKAEQAFYAYKKTVLEGLEETENAIDTLHYELERYQYLSHAEKAQSESHELTLQLFQKGFKNYVDVLISSKAQLAAQDALIQSHINLLLDYIALYKALGV